MTGVNLEETLSALNAGLRKDLRFSRQDFRGQPRYVAHDPLSFRNHVFSPHEYRIMTAVVPEMTLEENFERLVSTGVLGGEDRERFYSFIVKLHCAQLVRLPITSTDAFIERAEFRRAAKRKNLLSGLIYAKLPGFNPDPFLDRTKFWFSWVFSKVGFALWASLMAIVGWTCASRLDDFVPDVERLFAIANLPVVWVLFILLKVLHEFGHAYACKRFGGEVPEMGIAFIIMTPCAYVDAGASWKFQSRWERVTVGLGGMWVETFVAGIAALVWAGTQPGVAHDVALNIIVLASVTTFLGNANPLIRFDGYYVLSDLLGVFNLSKRAAETFSAFAKRLFLGLPSQPSPFSPRERWIYLLYGPASFAYKVILAFTITGVVLMKWSGPGILLGIVFCWLLIVNRLRRLVVYLLRAQETEPVRRRARMVAASGVVVCTLLLMFCPVSLTVVAPGVLEPGVTQSLRAPANGFVIAEHVEHGSDVRKGDLAFELESPAIEMKRLRLAGELEAERIRLDVEELRNATRAAVHKTRVAFLEAHVARIDRQLESMRMRAKLQGKAVSETRGWLGRYVLEGEELCQVHSDLRLVEVVLTDEEFSRTRLEVGSEAVVQWNCDPTQRVNAVVSEIRRSASRSHVPLELTMLAGGEIYARRDGAASGEADEPYLHVFFRTESVPVAGGYTGLTARVRIPARLQTLGDWISGKLLYLYNVWRMS